MHENCSKLCYLYPYLCLTLSSLLKNVDFFAENHFFIRKIKIQHGDYQAHVLSKVVKNVVLQHKNISSDVLHAIDIIVVSLQQWAVMFMYL